MVLVYCFEIHHRVQRVVVRCIGVAVVRDMTVLVYSLETVHLGEPGLAFCWGSDEGPKEVIEIGVVPDDFGKAMRGADNG